LRAAILRWEREERWRLLVVAAVVVPLVLMVVALVVVVAGLTGDWRPAAMGEDAEEDEDRGVGTWSEALLLLEYDDSDDGGEVDEAMEDCRGVEDDGKEEEEKEEEEK
jgi:hypothetical protein